MSYPPKNRKLIKNNTLFLHTPEVYDIFQTYHKMITGKHIIIDDPDIDTYRIPEMNGNYVYVMFEMNDSMMTGIFNTFVNSHIFYNNDEYVTDNYGFVKEQKHNHIPKGELMRIDDYGNIKDKKMSI